MTLIPPDPPGTDSVTPADTGPARAVAARPQHQAQTGFGIVDGCLQVGGISLPRLAMRAGRTPFFAYDRALLTGRVAALRAALPAALRLHYSVKANPMPAVVQHMAGLVDGLDVASSGEMQVALDAGMAPARISFAGPGKTDAELSAAIGAGVFIHVESEGELHRAAALGSAAGIVPNIVVRVNPPFVLKSSGMKMGGGASAFGIDAEQVPALLAAMRTLPVEFQGLHIFAGSQCLRADAIIEAQTQLFALAIELAAQSPWPLRHLNLGGGFGIPYFPGEQSLDLARIGAHLHASLPALQAALPQARIAIELGRYLVGEAGVYVARVTERKLSRGKVFLVTDGGMHHHLAASGNFGQVIRKNYPVAVGNRMDQPAAAPVSVVGPLCTPLDVLAEQMALPDAAVGDLVVVFQSGAYGRSASPAGFLSHPAAHEMLV